VEASTEPQDMRLQRLLGHLSALMHDNPKDVLVVRLWCRRHGRRDQHPSHHRAHGDLRDGTLIPKIVSNYFREANYGVAENRKVSIVYDDARPLCAHDAKENLTSLLPTRFILWVKGAATLYTREYFENVKAHLNSRRRRDAMGAAV